jgi:DNA-binding transcriptional LysR family regulator
MLLEQSAAMKAHLKARKVQPSLQFSITSQHYTFAVEALAALIEKLEASPKMTERYEINFREGKSTAVIEEVAEGISAIGIIALTEVNRLFLERAIKSKALTFHPLANIRQHVYLSASHPLSSESAISLESLKSYPRLTYKKDDLPQAFSEEGNHLKFAAKVIYLNDRATMDKLLMTTTGYNIGTGCLSRDSYRDWLRVIPLINGYDMTIGCITRKDIVFTDHLAYYFEALKAAVQQSLPETSNAADTLPKT